MKAYVLHVFICRHSCKFSLPFVCKSMHVLYIFSVHISIPTNTDLYLHDALTFAHYDLSVYSGECVLIQKHWCVGLRPCRNAWLVLE